MKRLLVSLAIVTAGLMMAAPGQAVATSQVFDITSDHATGGLGTAPFGTVTLLTEGAGVQITVHLNAGYWFVKTGSVDFQAFKFNATGVGLGDITIDGHIPTLAAATGAFNGNGTGSFTFGINCPGCGNGASDKFNTDIVFHVANATFAHLTQANSLGIIFVVDLLSDSTGNTGPADVTAAVTAVPEPSALLLAGTALLGIGYSIRNRIFRRTKEDVAAA